MLPKCRTETLFLYEYQPMKYKRMPIEAESPESLGYDTIQCNLAESSVRDVQFREIDCNLSELVICYGDHIGKPELRALIAAPHPGMNASDVLLTVGAAGALFIIHTSILAGGDHLIVVRPNYATNIETPRAIGVSVSFIELDFDHAYALDLEKVKSAIGPDTKMISITNPHNPTGTVMSESLLRALCALAEAHQIYLLVDETYRDLSFFPAAPLAASISEWAISVSSLSKAYGIPGIRLGWIMHRNPVQMELFLAAKEQIHICNSVVDEEMGFHYLKKKGKYFPAIQSTIQSCFAMLDDWMRGHPQLEWIRPAGGVVCFPRFRPSVDIDTDAFYSLLLQQYKTYVGPGHWFEQSDRSFRLGFGWETVPAFKLGLENIDRAIAATLRKPH